MSVRIDWTASKLMPTLLAISCMLRLLPYMTRLCTISTFLSVVASLGRQTVHHHQYSASPPQFSSPFLQCAIRRRLLPKGFPWSPHEFPWETFPSYRGTLWLLSLQLSPFCQFDTPLPSLQLFPTVIKSFKFLFSLPKTFNKTELSTDWDFNLLNLSILGWELFNHTS